VQSIISYLVLGPHWPPKEGRRPPPARSTRPMGTCEGEEGEGGVGRRVHERGGDWEPDGNRASERGVGQSEDWQGAWQLIAALQLLARPPRNRQPALPKLPAGRRVVRDVTLGLGGLMNNDGERA